MNNCQSIDRRQAFQKVVLQHLPDVERVPRGACPAIPPTNEQRWSARQSLYRALRNQKEAIA